MIHIYQLYKRKDLDNPTQFQKCKKKNDNTESPFIARMQKNVHLITLPNVHLKKVKHVYIVTKLDQKVPVYK